MAVVTALTGQDPVVIPPEPRIRGVVAANGTGWRLTLSLFDGPRERSRVIAAPSCPELTRAAGVALALALDPDGKLAAPGPPEVASAADSFGASEVPTGSRQGMLDAHAPAGSSDRMPAPATPIAVADADAVREQVVSAEAARENATGTEAAGPAPVALEWRLEAGALLDAAALGAASPGLALSVGARHDALTASVYGAWLPARRQGVDGGGAVEFSLGAVGVRGCHELARGLLSADACAGVELGRLEARGERLENAASFSDWWLAPSVGIALGSTLAGSMYFRAGADALVPVLREAYRVNDVALVHRAPSVGFRGGLALGVVLGGGS